MKSALLLLFTSLLSPAAFSQVIYNIDFETPDQSIGQLVRTGPAPSYVTTILFGTPKVVSAFGPLTHQPLMFNSVGQQPLGTGYYYTQVGLSIPQHAAQIVDLSFDFVDVGSQHAFTILFEAPNVRNFEFYGGQISFINPLLPDRTIGSYQLGTAYRIGIQLDYGADTWSLRRNGNLIAQGDLDASSHVSSIRFNYSAADSNITGTAIDNLVFAVPEPSHLTFSGLAILGLLRRTWQAAQLRQNR